MERKILETLLNELVATDQMMLVIDSHGAVSEMHVHDAKSPEFEGNYATIESRDWHIHLDVSAVDGVQFVESENHGHDFPKIYYVRLSNAAEDTVLRFYFPNPWLDDDENPTEFQPERLELFENFRDRYVQREGVAFVRR